MTAGLLLTLLCRRAGQGCRDEDQDLALDDDYQPQPEPGTGNEDFLILTEKKRMKQQCEHVKVCCSLQLYLILTACVSLSVLASPFTLVYLVQTDNQPDPKVNPASTLRPFRPAKTFSRTTIYNFRNMSVLIIIH